MPIFEVVKYVFTIRKKCDDITAISLDWGWVFAGICEQSTGCTKGLLKRSEKYNIAPEKCRSEID
jgi:hypothetical protein